ncbi:MAG: hypothetical protein RIR07_1123, partial [Bacteroidota bacterium]
MHPLFMIRPLLFAALALGTAAQAQSLYR